MFQHTHKTKLQHSKSSTAPKIESAPLPYKSIQRAIETPTLQTLTPDVIHVLQRTYGNQFVQRLIHKARTLDIHASPRQIQRNGVKELIRQHEQEQIRSGQTRTSQTDVSGEIMVGNTRHRSQQHEEAVDDTLGGSLGLEELFGTDTEQVGTDETSRLRRQHAHNIALIQHGEDRNRLTEYLQAGRTHPTDRRLRNSCEWILKGKTNLYAITRTGDSDERVRARGMNPLKDAAFFPIGRGGAGHVLAAPVDYNWQDISVDDPNVVLDPDGKSTAGWNGAGYIAITNASEASRDYVWETIRHEVQHDSDKNRDKFAAATHDVDRLFELYKTEYRAYNYEGGNYERFSDVTLVNRIGFTWTEKQWNIFMGIWSAYSHTKALWDVSDPDPNQRDTPRSGNHITRRLPPLSTAQTKAAILQIRQDIVNYRNPDAEGFNKWNSVRVDDFYTALKAVPDNTDVGNDPNTWAHPRTMEQTQVQELVEKINKLDHDDGQYILNEAPDYTTLLANKLTGTTLAWIRNLIAAK